MATRGVKASEPPAELLALRLREIDPLPQRDARIRSSQAEPDPVQPAVVAESCQHRGAVPPPAPGGRRRP